MESLTQALENCTLPLGSCSPAPTVLLASPYPSERCSPVLCAATPRSPLHEVHARNWCPRSSPRSRACTRYSNSSDLADVLVAATPECANSSVAFCSRGGHRAPSSHIASVGRARDGASPRTADACGRLLSPTIGSPAGTAHSAQKSVGYARAFDANASTATTARVLAASCDAPREREACRDTRQRMARFRRVLDALTPPGAFGSSSFNAYATCGRGARCSTARSPPDRSPTPALDARDAHYADVASVSAALGARSGWDDDIEEYDSSDEDADRAWATPVDERLVEHVDWMDGEERRGAQGGLAAGGGLLVEGDFGLSTVDLARCVLQLVGRASPPRGGGTLVIVAPARLSFWASACARHAPQLRVITHHGAARARNPCALHGADVVLSTYNLLAATEYSVRAADVLSLAAAPSGTAVWRQAVSSSSRLDGSAVGASSMLHMHAWMRVVFDEADRHLAQPTTKRSRAAAALIAPRRWALAGAASFGRRDMSRTLLNNVQN
ncbi:hypothetical protein KFE25_009921 [Diacronema lutheri]|uniref:SNF2 N-terminal domain-containing protein n=1 Tax=Diacronema lutheri TaxID=2081491 RepID=A0A8J5XD62_DIALT|nr:hypothetical protein KFE25_009921 [Diacronema lutheri]